MNGWWLTTSEKYAVA